MSRRPSRPFRSGGNMAYDAARKLHILFGTQFGDDPHTWALRPPQERVARPEAADASRRPTATTPCWLTTRPTRSSWPSSASSTGRRRTRSPQGHLETWAYDAGKNTWTKMDPPREPDGWGNRRRMHGRRAGPERDPAGGLRQPDRTRARAWTASSRSGRTATRDARPDADAACRPTSVRGDDHRERGACVTWQPAACAGRDGLHRLSGRGRAALAGRVASDRRRSAQGIDQLPRRRAPSPAPSTTTRSGRVDARGPARAPTAVRVRTQPRAGRRRGRLGMRSPRRCGWLDSRRGAGRRRLPRRAGGRRGVQRGPGRAPQEGHAAAGRAERRGGQGDRPVRAADEGAGEGRRVHRHDARPDEAAGGRGRADATRTASGRTSSTPRASRIAMRSTPTASARSTRWASRAGRRRTC